jgi:uncharacterized protein YwbE
MSDEGLVVAIQQLLTDSPFHGEGYRKLWARLRFAGIRTSRRRVLRLMREHGLLAHQRAGRPHGPRAHDGTITTERIDVMWGSDLTSVMTGKGQVVAIQQLLTDSPFHGEGYRKLWASSLRSITARPSAWAFTPAAVRIASKLSSRSGKACASALVALPRAPPPACSCATIMAASM